MDGKQEISYLSFQTVIASYVQLKHLGEVFKLLWGILVNTCINTSRLNEHQSFLPTSLIIHSGPSIIEKSFVYRYTAILIPLYTTIMFF